jgi:hypothetical protein
MDALLALKYPDPFRLIFLCRLSYETARSIVYANPTQSQSHSSASTKAGRGRGGRGGGRRSAAHHLGIEFADLLARDRDIQKEADNLFLEHDLPKNFRKLRVREWMKEHVGFPWSLLPNFD